MHDTIRSFLKDTFPYDSAVVTDDDSLMDSGVLDSIAVLVLVTWLEETFEIRVADDDVVPENLDGINRLAAYIARKRADAGFGAGHAG